MHRDVFWLGRQWAVTGYGIQTVSKKFAMKFDVEAKRIWEEDIDALMRDEPWFDASDFADAVKQARNLSNEAPSSFWAAPSDER